MKDNKTLADKIVYNGEYFFVSKDEYEDRKTPIYRIWDRNAVCIALIKWYGPWRKFCFFPEGSGVVWDNKCLQEVIQLLDMYNKEYKESGNK